MPISLEGDGDGDGDGSGDGDGDYEDCTVPVSKVCLSL